MSHGYRRGKVSVGIIKHDSRKSQALYVAVGSVLHTAAYFRSDEDAERFYEALGYLLDVGAEPEES